MRVHRNCCGLDVHKQTIAACLISESEDGTSSQQKRIFGTMTQQLRELPRHEIIRRKVFAQVPTKVEYSLTRHGKSLKRILRLMPAWGQDHKSRYVA